MIDAPASRARKIARSIPFLSGAGFCVFGLLSMQYGLIMIGGIFSAGIAATYAIPGRVKGKVRRITTVVVAIAVIGLDICFGFFARGTLPLPPGSQVWRMHTIDNPGFLIPNGLRAADVNKDGFKDYLTNYEWDGKIRIAFHPGLGHVRDAWPSITVGDAPDAESSTFGDIDGDGNPDILIGHGAEYGGVSGVRVIWGPGASRAMDPAAYIDGGDIATSLGLGHINAIEAFDINGDNATDIVIGGRGTAPRTGLRWLEAPASISDRRNLAAWQLHDIDANIEGSHGFIFDDIDKDNSTDIAVCNADFDTPDTAKAIVWYRNPGTGTNAQKSPWPRHVVFQAPILGIKEQIALDDFTGDGYPEIVTQTRDFLHVFINPGSNVTGNSATWTHVQVQKPPNSTWTCRPITLADLNQDGKKEIIGALVHDNGWIPNDKATVFYMVWSGSIIDASWQTFPIKWSDGFVGLGAYNGEKWDQILVEDVDRDGDLDIAANVEEYHTLGFVFLAVVWFENPLY
ncbi:MAG: FG-GAP repeat domain-containing protein [Candidatus Sigynarchaeota archaeon]